MDAVLCLREAAHFQSMELERPEAICGLESGIRSRLWSTRGHCACGWSANRKWSEMPV